MSKEIIINILTEEDVLQSINDNLDILLKYIPELRFMIGFEHKHPHHHLDVWHHTLYALSLSKNDFYIRIALLLHDIGKPFCYQEGDIRHFKGHPKVSSMMANEILYRLSFDDNFIQEICYLISNHDNVITEEDIKKNYDLELKRYEIQRCDALAHHPDKLEKRIEYLNRTKKLFDTVVDKKKEKK